MMRYGPFAIPFDRGGTVGEAGDKVDITLTWGGKFAARPSGAD
jgi:hypothetical protein